MADRPGLAERAYDATWGRVFAAGYERMMAASEEAGLQGLRHSLIAQAKGRTLELGAGTGLNFDHYPDAVGELVLTEPFEPMARRLRERVGTSDHGGRSVEVVVAPAESLPFGDSSFDTVVVTLVLCTVDDLEATLAEIHRVLKPGGTLLFCEHVRSPDPSLARWQDRLHGPWKFIGHGCNCNRDTVAALEGSPLELGAVTRDRLPKAAAIVKPMAMGAAVKPA